jgi:hypothetical protein
MLKEILEQDIRYRVGRATLKAMKRHPSLTIAAGVLLIAVGLHESKQNRN